MSNHASKKIGIVLSGGGARGAYEAGVLHYIRTMLPEPARSRVFDIHTGASIGAINASFTASTADDPAYQGKKIYNLWSGLKAENIYQRDTRALLSFLKTSSQGLVSNLIFGAKKSKKHFKGFLDTTPLLPYL
ncbi:MAG: patatin-like phospholipase family protein, partial [Deltaproteobacteria bacterium]|nr:patatin-like phospholipase family protein [Deltaproteobacteria bacterium]